MHRHVCSVEREALRSKFREEEAFDAELAAEIEAAPLIIVSEIRQHRVYKSAAAGGTLRDVYVQVRVSPSPK